MRVINASLLAVERASTPKSSRHLARRALKRVAALSWLLPRVAGKPLRQGAKQLSRDFAPARDLGAALEALAGLSQKADADSVRVTLEAKLARLGGGALRPAQRAKLRRFARTSRVAAEHEPSTAQLLSRLTRHYRRLRKAAPRRWPRAQAERLHGVRAQGVIHQHQLQFVAARWGLPFDAELTWAKRLRETLGAHHDLEVLLRQTELSKKLRRAAKTQQRALAKAARRAHAALTEHSARHFGERLAQRVEHPRSRD